MADSESSDSPQVKLFYECTLGIQTRDLDRVAKVLHKDYRYVAYPRSLGKPEQTKEEWLGQYAGIINLWTSDSELIPRVIIDTPGKVVLHATNKVNTSVGVERNRESILIVHIVSDEDGSLKIKQMEEFMDSKVELDFAQAIAVAGVKNQ